MEPPKPPQGDWYDPPKESPPSPPSPPSSPLNGDSPAFPVVNYTSEIGPEGAGFFAKDSSGQSVWVNSGCPGMSLREYAAIELCVPDSGVDWLDDMITKSLRNRFAGMVLQGIISNREGRKVLEEHQISGHVFIAEVVCDIAGFMLAEFKKREGSDDG